MAYGSTTTEATQPETGQALPPRKSRLMSGGTEAVGEQPVRIASFDVDETEAARGALARTQRYTGGSALRETRTGVHAEVHAALCREPYRRP